MAKEPIGFDVETYKIEKGAGAPRVVCGAFFDGKRGVLLNRETTRKLLAQAMDKSETLVIGHNLAFDVVTSVESGLLTWQDVVTAMERGQWYCTMVAANLDGIAEDSFRKFNGRDTRYSLNDCAKYYLHVDNAKDNDEYRLRYGELDAIPIAQWPKVAREYPVDDVRNTFALWRVLATGGGNAHEVTRQTNYSIVLAEGGFSGLRFDSELAKTRLAEIVESRTKQALGLGKFLKFCPETQGAGATEGDEDTDDDSGNTLSIIDGVAGKFKKRTIEIKRAIVHAFADTLVSCGECNGSGVEPPRVLKNGKLSTAKAKNCRACQGVGYDAKACGAPLAKAGSVSTARDTLFESGDDELGALATYDADAKLVSTYLPSFIAQAAKHGKVTFSTNVLVETGRTSIEDGIGNMPRTGVRDCFYAPDGKVWISSDYAGMELTTHAQNCLNTVGYSRLAEILNDGGKPHNELAAKIAGTTVDALFGDPTQAKRAKGLRTSAKAGNFGYPGGMSAATLVVAKRREAGTTETSTGRVYQGLRFCVAVYGATECGTEKVRRDIRNNREIPRVCAACLHASHEIRDAWFETYPENRDYFAYVKREIERGRPHVAHVSHRVRSCASFTAFANSGFQALGADAAKAAMLAVWKRTKDLSDPVFRSAQFKAFFHDEIFLEQDDDPDLIDATVRQKVQIMIDAFRPYCPDVKIEVEPAVMRRWYKEAAPVFDEKGRYTVWNPQL